MAEFLKILSYVFMAVFLIGIVIMLLNWRRAKFVRPISILFGLALSFLSLWIFAVIAGHPVGLAIWLALISVGLAGGIWYGGTIKVKHTARGVSMSYTLPYIIVWAALLLITQFLTIQSGRVPAVVFGLSILSLGINTGVNGRVLWSSRRSH
ncbi:MAG: hypothetical protein Q7O66_19405 [Dehalococcoidia bacterium]|nr:hypothetical protein [Dehalococcoidia bacterium]